ncbi:MAG: hypothetical protein N3A61_02455 [Ignavibacteria bacterium]|nr:hypothetical protein [Ignavibacteria bacterium]
MKMRIALLSLLVIITVSFVSCFPGDMNYTTKSPAGFFTGIWHGWIAPISLIVGLFKDGIRIYEVNNTGWWYDFGFYIAIISGFGGVALSRKKRKSD